MNPAKLAGSGALLRPVEWLGHNPCKVSSSSSERLAPRASAPWRRSPPRSSACFAFIILRVTAPQMSPVFTDLTRGGFGRDREGPGAPGHPLRAEERRRHRAGAARPHDPRAHEARRRRPAQGRRRRLRDLRQVRHARRHQLRAEHQSSARARRRACAAPSRRSTACRPRACTSCCRNGRCSRATRSSRRPRSCCACAARWKRARCARSAISSLPRSMA